MTFLPLLSPPEAESRYVTATTDPGAAGIHDRVLDGMKTFDKNTEAALAAQKTNSDASHLAKENRSFLRRCIRYMLGHGIRQFIDIGSGHITINNIYELAHSVDPATKIVYVDRDPAVVKNGRRVLATIETSAIICGDIREPDDVLKQSDLSRIIDFSKPVGILMVRVACFFTDSELARIMMAI